MGDWKWRGFTREGETRQGTLAAETEQELRKALRRQGIRVTRVQKPSMLEVDLNEALVKAGLVSPFKKRELVRFTKQLQILVDAGVPLMETLDILHKQEKNPQLKRTLRKVAGDVGEGMTLYEALSRQQGFGVLYCNLIKAGEAGGILDTILEKLVEYMEKQEKLVSQVKGALIYPSIVVTVGIGVVMAMMVFVVPGFVGMVTASGGELPGLTQFIIDCSDLITNNLLMIGLGTVGGLIFFFQWKKTKTGKVAWDQFTMNMPVFGNVVIKGNLGSFSRTLATMINAGVSLIDALDICVETIDNTVIVKDIRKIRKAVTEGKTLTEPLARVKYFPDMVAQMIKVGETTGNLDSMLIKVSDVFEKDVEDSMGMATKMIEPIIIVVLGGIIALILVGMYLPMFESGANM